MDSPAAGRPLLQRPTDGEPRRRRRRRCVHASRQTGTGTGRRIVSCGLLRRRVGALLSCALSRRARHSRPAARNLPVDIEYGPARHVHTAPIPSCTVEYQVYCSSLVHFSLYLFSVDRQVRKIPSWGECFFFFSCPGLFFYVARRCKLQYGCH